MKKLIKYQRGGIKREPYVSLQTKNINFPTGNKLGFGARLSVPFLERINHGRSASGLRGEIDYTFGKGNTNLRGDIESTTSAGTLPTDMATSPKVSNSSFGLRGFHNQSLGRNRNYSLNANAGFGLGTGNQYGEYIHKDPQGFGGTSYNFGSSPQMKPYGDANISLLRKGIHRGTGLDVSGGLNASYGTSNAPNPGLRLGAKGSFGPFSANAGYDFTNKTPTAGLSLNFQKGGVRRYQTAGRRETVAEYNARMDAEYKVAMQAYSDSTASYKNELEIHDIVRSKVALTRQEDNPAVIRYSNLHYDNYGRGIYDDRNRLTTSGGTGGEKLGPYWVPSSKHGKGHWVGKSESNEALPTKEEITKKMKPTPPKRPKYRDVEKPITPIKPISIQTLPTTGIDDAQLKKAPPYELIKNNSEFYTTEMRGFRGGRYIKGDDSKSEINLRDSADRVIWSGTQTEFKEKYGDHLERGTTEYGDKRKSRFYLKEFKKGGVKTLNKRRPRMYQTAGPKEITTATINTAQGQVTIPNTENTTFGSFEDEELNNYMFEDNFQEAHNYINGPRYREKLVAQGYEDVDGTIAARTAKLHEIRIGRNTGQAGSPGVSQNIHPEILLNPTFGYDDGTVDHEIGHSVGGSYSDIKYPGLMTKEELAQGNLIPINANDARTINEGNIIRQQEFQKNPGGAEVVDAQGRIKGTLYGYTVPDETFPSTTQVFNKEKWDALQATKEKGEAQSQILQIEYDTIMTEREELLNSKRGQKGNLRKKDQARLDAINSRAAELGGTIYYRTLNNRKDSKNIYNSKGEITSYKNDDEYTGLIRESKDAEKLGYHDIKNVTKGRTMRLAEFSSEPHRHGSHEVEVYPEYFAVQMALSRELDYDNTISKDDPDYVPITANHLQQLIDKGGEGSYRVKGLLKRYGTLEIAAEKLNTVAYDEESGGNQDFTGEEMQEGTGMAKFGGPRKLNKRRPRMYQTAGTKQEGGEDIPQYTWTVSKSDNYIEPEPLEFYSDLEGNTMYKNTVLSTQAARDKVDENIWWQDRGDFNDKIFNRQVDLMDKVYDDKSRAETYISSSEYLKRLQNQGYENAAQMQADRLKNVQDTQIILNSNRGTLDHYYSQNQDGTLGKEYETPVWGIYPNAYATHPKALDMHAPGVNTDEASKIEHGKRMAAFREYQKSNPEASFTDFNRKYMETIQGERAPTISITDSGVGETSYTKDMNMIMTHELGHAAGGISTDPLINLNLNDEQLLKELNRGYDSYYNSDGTLKRELHGMDTHSITAPENYADFFMLRMLAEQHLNIKAGDKITSRDLKKLRKMFQTQKHSGPTVPYLDTQGGGNIMDRAIRHNFDPKGGSEIINTIASNDPTQIQTISKKGGVRKLKKRRSRTY